MKSALATADVGGPGDHVRMPSTADLLDFEAAHPRWTGRKDELCMSELGLRPARYYQLLHRAVDTEEALQHDPATTHRVRRLLERRSSERERRLATR